MNYIAQNKNPYDEDDDWVDRHFVNIYSEQRKVYWFNQNNEGGTWYASNGAFINTTFFKVEPYNGILDIGIAVRNNDGDQDREAERIWQFLKLIDSTPPEIVGEYVDDSELKESCKLKFYIRFNEPVFSSKLAAIGSSIEVKFNNGSTNYYATYAAGNYTDTLCYELTGIPKANITSINYQLPNNDIGDMAINRDKYKAIINNKIPEDITNTTRTMTILNGSINLITPSLSIDNPSSTQARNAYNLLLSINGNGEKDLNEGTIYYEWSLDSQKENHNDPDAYERYHTFAKEENGSFGLTLVKNEADGINSGGYYLHALAESKYGLINAQTFGPYVLDGDPPVVEQKVPLINDLKTKEYELVVKDKTNGTSITKISLLAKYLDSEENSKEASLVILEDEILVEELRKFIRTVYDDTNKETHYYFKSNISDQVLDDLGNPLIDEFILGLMEDVARRNFDISFVVEDEAGNKSTSNIVKATFDRRDLFKIKMTLPLANENGGDGYTVIDDIFVSYNAYDYSTVVNNKGIVIEILDETLGGTVEGNNYREFLVDGTKFSVLVNGVTYEADGTDGDDKY